MAIHSSILAWKIPWIEEPGGLHPMGSVEAGTQALPSPQGLTLCDRQHQIRPAPRQGWQAISRTGAGDRGSPGRHKGDVGAGAEGDENPVTQQPQDDGELMRHCGGTGGTGHVSDLGH